ncbi:MAG: AAA family ATPase [Candidatus Adiutrix sp.]|jgi:ATP-dependent 26S proteasome regulatory subunit|nr:AAA family ATPase [Candidatus Adiutrix sp.]
MNETQRETLNLELLIRAGYGLIYVLSPEEPRILEAAAQIGRRLGWKVYEWSCLSGLGPRAGPPDPATLAPAAALQAAAKHREAALFIFKDLHPYLNREHQNVIRALREAAQNLPGRQQAVIMTGPVLDLPPELEKDVAVSDFPLPGEEEIGALLDDTAGHPAAGPDRPGDLSGPAREEIIKAARGLTLVEARRAFAKVLVRDGRLGAGQIREILSEKRQIIRKSGLLEYYEPDLGLEDVGGLDNLKQWLAKRKLAFSDQAAAFGLPAPRGVLLLGVQGCGKSVCAKAIARLWNVPLLRLDLGRIFEARLGGSEGNIRRAISMAEAVAPCLLWIDEIDKTFGGQNAESHDGGTAQRVLGAFLTWMAEKKSPVFVAATANNVSSLPAELLRKGRFDEIFFVDIPNEEERRHILAIHLGRRGRNPADHDLAALGQAMEGFNGAEIEQAVIAGLFSAFDDHARALTDWDLTLAAAETVPLSKTMREEVEALRRWCHGRARPASESSRMKAAARLAAKPGAAGR